MRIPLEQLAPDTLTAIIEHFVLREGTDYGDQEMSFAEKVAQVRTQLESGEALLVYAEAHGTVTILPAARFGGRPRCAAPTPSAGRKDGPSPQADQALRQAQAKPGEDKD